ncbi:MULTISPECIES: TenA family protein [unclassified Rhizobium]|uniref:TenA family protein n=1 Tax=unclassified Rhizobium TaxID=2613769 RepID=UPI00104401BB|nr:MULTISPECIES: TenA family protein [unclassified Rhizobium]MBB3396428.1 thiaminase/transcriptional activator TenA [Rhizobium sp. BK060]MBB4170175.1 thiaminase/transcriptional activator TenA [Rhizobium sp. BK538]TCM76331.1 thiaminase/transcriptional activator TenA [Rhizobium sp. BK068]
MVETLSEQILRENKGVFDAMVGHRFVENIKADKLPKDVFERYLVFEGAFVDTAISIFAFAAAKAETIAQKRWLSGVLDALANQQVAYFEKTFAERGIDPAACDTSIPEVAAFRDGMLAISRDGGYLDTVAAMFAAEWMYWTWSKEAAQHKMSDPLLKEWVDLHAHEDFAAQARWLKAELDAAGEAMGPEERSRLSAIFGRAQALEIAFHDAPYL